MSLHVTLSSLEFKTDDVVGFRIVHHRLEYLSIFPYLLLHSTPPNYSRFKRVILLFFSGSHPADPRRSIRSGHP